MGEGPEARKCRGAAGCGLGEAGNAESRAEPCLPPTPAHLNPLAVPRTRVARRGLEAPACPQSRTCPEPLHLRRTCLDQNLPVPSGVVVLAVRMRELRLRAPRNFPEAPQW